jgi:hypothetical protein
MVGRPLSARCELGAIVSINEILENIDASNRGKEWPDPCGCFQRK